MEIIIGIGVLALAIFAMAIGVIFNNKPLKGSCGGKGGKIVIDGVEMACPTCGGDTGKCESQDINPD
ncbi:MAG: ApbE family protein [Fidelibacterota bacterium]